MLTMDSIPLNNNNNGNNNDDNNNMSETKQENENTSVPETPLLVGDEELLSDGSTEEEVPITDYIKPDGMPATPMLRPIAPAPEYALPLDDDFFL